MKRGKRPRTKESSAPAARPAKRPHTPTSHAAPRPEKVARPNHTREPGTREPGGRDVAEQGAGRRARHPDAKRVPQAGAPAHRDKVRDEPPAKPSSKGENHVRGPRPAQNAEQTTQGGEASVGPDSLLRRTELSMSGHPLPPLPQLTKTLAQFRHLQRLDLARMQPTPANPHGLSSLAWLAAAVVRGRKAAMADGRSDEDEAAWFGKSVTTLDVRENEALGAQGDDAWVGIQRLEHLRVIQASRCGLASLPPPALLPTSLCVLVLSNNGISSLPSTLPTLPNLNTLVLSHNRLRALPRTLAASLPALKKLSLSDNALQHSRPPPDLEGAGDDGGGGRDGTGSSESTSGLPDLSACSHLREVRLNGNAGIRSLPAHLARWGRGVGKNARGTGLEVLELGDCGLEHLDDVAPLLEPSASTDATASGSAPALGRGGGPARRKGLRNLTLKGNPVADIVANLKEKILEAHPELAVYDGHRLVPKAPKATASAVPSSGKGSADAATHTSGLPQTRDSGHDPEESHRLHPKATGTVTDGLEARRKDATGGREAGQKRKRDAAARSVGARAADAQTPERDEARASENVGRTRAQDDGSEADVGSKSDGAGGTSAKATHRGARGATKTKKVRQARTAKEPPVATGATAAGRLRSEGQREGPRDALLVFGEEGDDDGRDVQVKRARNRAGPPPNLDPGTDIEADVGVRSDDEEDDHDEDGRKGSAGQAGDRPKRLVSASANGRRDEGEKGARKRGRRGKRGAAARHGDAHDAPNGLDRRAAKAASKPATLSEVSARPTDSDWMFAKKPRAEDVLLPSKPEEDPDEDGDRDGDVDRPRGEERAMAPSKKGRKPSKRAGGPSAAVEGKAKRGANASKPSAEGSDAQGDASVGGGRVASPLRERTQSAVVGIVEVGPAARKGGTEPERASESNRPLGGTHADGARARETLDKAGLGSGRGVGASGVPWGGDLGVGTGEGSAWE